MARWQAGSRSSVARQIGARRIADFGRLMRARPRRSGGSGRRDRSPWSSRAARRKGQRRFEAVMVEDGDQRQRRHDRLAWRERLGIAPHRLPDRVEGRDRRFSRAACPPLAASSASIGNARYRDWLHQFKRAHEKLITTGVRSRKSRTPALNAVSPVARMWSRPRMISASPLSQQGGQRFGPSAMTSSSLPIATSIGSLDAAQRILGHRLAPRFHAGGERRVVAARCDRQRCGTAARPAC